MGRSKFYRQRILNQAAAVDAKSFYDYLLNEIRHRREVPLEEAVLITRDVLDYLTGVLDFRGFGRIVIPAIAGLENHYHKSRENQEEKLVTLTLVADQDAALLKEGGTLHLQTARIARVIEEAREQGCLLDFRRLCLLFPLSARAIRARLQKLWVKGAALPVAGMSKSNRLNFKASRCALGIERYLKGEPLRQILFDLAVPQPTWDRWWQLFNQETPGSDLAEELAELKKRYPVQNTSPEAIVDRESFGRRLRQRHGYSPAAAESFLMELEELAKEFRLTLQPGQLLYSAVEAQEPPGKPLAQCSLVNTVLDYVTEEDWELVNTDSPRALKWERLRRLTTGAYAQGATLSQSDLSYLMSISVDAVQDCIKAHPQVVLPTRGFVADMGPTLSHAEKIIALYMDGYTETEIKRRTSHSYDSIERYLIDFARVVLLTEKGMPLPMVRQVLGFSRRVVEKYQSLHRQFNTPDYSWRMERIRRIATAHPVKKTRGSDACAKAEGAVQYPSPKRCPACPGSPSETPFRAGPGFFPGPAGGNPDQQRA